MARNGMDRSIARTPLILWFRLQRILRKSAGLSPRVSLVLALMLSLSLSLILFMAPFLWATRADAETLPPSLTPSLPRVISASLCGDYYLLAFAQPEQIIALSALATDHTLSAFADRAKAFPSYDGRLETLARLKADLIIVSAYTPKDRRDMMEKLGYQLVILDGAQTWAQTRDEALRLGDAIGRSTQSRDWLAAMDRDLAQLPRPSRPLKIVSYDRRGVTAGAGHMLDDMIKLLGHENAAQQLTSYAEHSRPLSLERLLWLKPDLVLVSNHYAYADRGSEILDHAAFIAALPESRRLVVHDRWTHCAGPSTLPALTHMITKISEKVDVYPSRPDGLQNGQSE
jgi:iron complex transport system substrate-binding protein